MAKQPLKVCAYCDAKMLAEKMQCVSCRKWQPSFIEINSLDETILLSDVSDATEIRLTTGPWDEAFGGGILGSRVWMIGGGPGAGKSTLMLQLSNAIAAATGKETLYVAAEENGPQIKSRAKRLNLSHSHQIRLMPMGARGDIGSIMTKRKPCFMVIDSISSLTGDLDEQCVLSERLKTYATLHNITILIVNQISQESDFAGKVKLQHAVDALFTFYADDDGVRSLFVEKNRDGQAQIRLAFGMKDSGLFPLVCDACAHNLYRCVCNQPGLTIQ